MSRRWTIRKTSKQRNKPTLAGWKVEGWVADKFSWKKDFKTFGAALSYVVRAISNAAVHDLLDRLNETETGEYEAIEAALVTGLTLAEKRVKIYAAGRERGLYLRTEVEVEDDPRDTLILAKVVRRGGAR